LKEASFFSSISGYKGEGNGGKKRERKGGGKRTCRPMPGILLFFLEYGEEKGGGGKEREKKKSLHAAHPLNFLG